MKIVQLFVAVVLVVSVLAPVASAQETKAINLALFDPVQIYKRDTSVKGFRFSLIYGNNADLKGVDLGLVNRLTGTATGIQWGVAVNWTEGDFTGWQNAPLQKVGGHMTGVQTGLIASLNGTGKGFQTAAVTISDDFIGLQLGIVNYAVELHGIQIGLINIIKNGGMLPFFPIFNFSFDE